jgi:hypothetical protein
MRWSGHVARIGENRSAYWVLMVEEKNLNPYDDPGTERKTVLKLTLREAGWGWYELNSAGCCKLPSIVL